MASTPAQRIRRYVGVQNVVATEPGQAEPAVSHQDPPGHNEDTFNSDSATYYHHSDKVGVQANSTIRSSPETLADDLERRFPRLDTSQLTGTPEALAESQRALNSSSGLLFCCQPDGSQHNLRTVRVQWGRDETKSGSSSLRE
jgi:hypothetical protein